MGGGEEERARVVDRRRGYWEGGWVRCVGKLTGIGVCGYGRSGGGWAGLRWVGLLHDAVLYAMVVVSHSHK